MEVSHRASSAWQWMVAKLVGIFSADLRSLATLRLVLALLVLVDLRRRATDLVAHYSDQGILPLADLVSAPYTFSLNTLNGSPEFQALLFGLAALGSLSMLIGYRTRLSTFVVWLLVLSIQLRNPLVLTAGDTLLHLLLFWSIFLPLGAVWSVDRVRSDARHTSQRPLSMRFSSLAVAALFLQIALMYWVTAFNKSGGEWRWDGTALYYALSYDRGSTEFGTYLLNFPTLLVVLTFASLALEALGPFLLFSPLANGPLRTSAVVAFMGFHFSILLTIGVGLFSLIAALCMVCFLPGGFWDTLAPKLRSALVRRLNVLRRSLPSPVGGGEAGSPNPRRRTVQHRGNVPSVSYVVGGGWTPSPAQDAGTLAEESSEEKERAHSETARYRPMVLRSSLLTNLLALGFLLNVLCWNLAVVSPLPLPTPAYQVGSFFGLSQSWEMFAPAPPREDGWWVIPGELEGGQQVDVLPVIHNDYRLQDVSYDKPRDIASTVTNWQKYLNYMTTTEYTDTPERRADQEEKRATFSSYLCKEWNERHSGEESLESLKIAYMAETTPPPGQSPETERELMHEQSCN